MVQEQRIEGVIAPEDMFDADGDVNMWVEECSVCFEDTRSSTPYDHACCSRCVDYLNASMCGLHAESMFFAVA